MDDKSALGDESNEIDWIEALSEFKNEIFPLFEKHGVTIGEAMIIWEINRLRNAINDVEEVLKDGGYRE